MHNHGGKDNMDEFIFCWIPRVHPAQRDGGRWIVGRQTIYLRYDFLVEVSDILSEVKVGDEFCILY